MYPYQEGSSTSTGEAANPLLAEDTLVLPPQCLHDLYDRTEAQTTDDLQTGNCKLCNLQQHNNNNAVIDRANDGHTDGQHNWECYLPKQQELPLGCGLLHIDISYAHGWLSDIRKVCNIIDVILPKTDKIYICNLWM